MTEDTDEEDDDEEEEEEEEDEEMAEVSESAPFALDARRVPAMR